MEQLLAVLGFIFIVCGAFLWLVSGIHTNARSHIFALRIVGSLALVAGLILIWGF